MVFQWCLKFKGSFKDVSKKYKGYFKKVSRVINEVSEKFQGCFKKFHWSLRGLQGYLKEV